MTILRAMRVGARRLGLEVERATPMSQWRVRLPALLDRQRIDTVVDIGGNDGGFAAELLESGYQGKVYSFEPLPDAWERIHARSLAYKGRWTVGPRIALSDQEGEVEFHEAGNSASSSLLVMTDAHLTAAPHTGTVKTHVVRTRRLDDVLASMPEISNFYLKIDVQGAERLVLDGATEALRKAVRGLQIEMSLSELYEGQSTAAELDRYIRDFGFVLWDILPGFRNPDTLQLLQYDGVYIRTGKSI